MIFGGDLEFDFCRVDATSVQILNSMIKRESLQKIESSSIHFTFKSKINFSESVLNYIFVSDNLINCVEKYSVSHSGDNMSDHSPLFVSLNISITCYDSYSSSSYTENKLQWHKASLQDFQTFHYVVKS